MDVPMYTRGHCQLPADDVEATCKLANVLIHVECVIGAVHQCFRILFATGVLPKALVENKTNGENIINSVVHVCSALNNVCEGPVPM